MSSLEDLPDELLVAVVGYLRPPSLPKVSLVNHRFHSLTISHLYATFAGPKAQQFLRTITTSQDQYRLAERVKKVQWRAYINDVKDPTGVRAKIKRCITGSERQPVIKAYQQLGLRGPSDSCGPPLDVLFARKLNPYEHWYLEFFLSFLPNVTDVEIHDAWHWDDCIRW
ncbi:hypothetical protein DE146DRAFT_646603 [Phaeosphaeria sp. MPI-PUGE-AT-0046c]|nr:hypothetical protein DE146DRAFT_646603 [Phaeosphaeria sp. MPI-PUGE-AT-0046c]